MRHIVIAAFGLWISLGGAAMAQSEQGVVVELYTSQGCSSCPPADEFLAGLVADPGVIALSLHVDYWDYIGWRDIFASPDYTVRQKAYARAIGSRTIYTPQMIVGGLDRVEGTQPDQVGTLLRKHMKLHSPVKLSLDRHGNQLAIHAQANAPITAGSRVQLVRYKPSQTVNIERGENAGKTVTYHNIVTEWTDLGDWSGEAPLDMTAQVTGSEPVVVIIQTEGLSLILAAARLN